MLVVGGFVAPAAGERYVVSTAPAPLQAIAVAPTTGASLGAEGAVDTAGLGVLVDLRGDLAYDSTKFSVRIPGAFGAAATQREGRPDGSGAALGNITLSLDHAWKLAIEDHRSYWFGLRAALSLPTSVKMTGANEELLRSIAFRELSRAPGDVFSSELAPRLQLAIGYQSRKASYQVWLGAAIVRSLHGVEYWDERTEVLFAGFSAARNMGSLDVVGEVALCGSESNLGTAARFDLGVRLHTPGRVTLTATWLRQPEDSPLLLGILARLPR